MIQNEAIKLQLYQMSSEAEQRLLEQQELELNKQRMQSTYYGQPVAPITYD
ncbi:minor pilin of type IV secretion complex [Vibrio astriarenae]|nr:minor pilin of type IV secretion complex [Vibrio sp. C7]